jgi:endonuclease III
MTKKELVLEVIRRLKAEYPDSECSLDYDDAWKLLVSVRLAAQCTDARVNVVVKGLYEKYPDIASLAAASFTVWRSTRRTYLSSVVYKPVA